MSLFSINAFIFWWGGLIRCKFALFKYVKQALSKQKKRLDQHSRPAKSRKMDHLLPGLPGPAGERGPVRRVGCHPWDSRSFMCSLQGLFVATQVLTAVSIEQRSLLAHPMGGQGAMSPGVKQGRAAKSPPPIPGCVVPPNITRLQGLLFLTAEEDSPQRVF